MQKIYLLLEFKRLIHLARKAIDYKYPARILIHLLLEKRDGDLVRHYLTGPYHTGYYVRVLRIILLRFPQKLACRQVRGSELLG